MHLETLRAGEGRVGLVADALREREDFGIAHYRARRDVDLMLFKSTHLETENPITFPSASTFSIRNPVFAGTRVPLKTLFDYTQEWRYAGGFSRRLSHGQP